MSRVTCHVSPQFSMNILMVAVRVSVPPPHQLCSLLSPEPAPPIAHQPAQAAAVTTAVGISSGLHRWQHSAVWKLPRKGLDKNIALHCISTVTVDCGLQCARYPVPGLDIRWIFAVPSLGTSPGQGSARQSRHQHQDPGSYRILESRHGAASPRRLVMVLVLGGVSARVVKSSQSQRRSLGPSHG